MKKSLKQLEEELLSLSDPDAGVKNTLSKTLEQISKIAENIVPPEDGHTPIKGVDYFTEEEISSIIKYIQSNVQNGVDGKDGLPGKKGEPGRPGKDGATPIKGIDYYTTEERSKLIADVLTQIKIPKDGISPKIEDIVSRVTEVMSETNSGENEFVTIKGLIDFLKRGGYRGGGGGSGSAISVSDEGVLLTSALSSLNFAGSGVTVTAVGNDVTVTIASVTGYVPYTGATADVDLGAFNLSAKSLLVTGTGGDGHIHLKHQTVDPVATGSSTALFANVNGDIEYKNAGNYYTTFKTSLNTADRIYTFLDASYNVLGSTTALTTGSILFANANGLISQDNTAFYWDDTNNRLLLNTNSPAALSGNTTLSVMKDGVFAIVQAYGYGAAGSNGGIYAGYSAGGTFAAPTAVPISSTIVSLSARGYDGTAWSVGSQASIALTAAETWSSTARGTNILFNTTPTGSLTNTGAAVLSSAGNFYVGGTSPQFTRFAILGTRSAAYSTNTTMVVFDSTFTDTSSTGTVASIRSTALGTPTFAASSTTTYTIAANLYISNPAIAGTNVTITNTYAIYVANGNNFFGGTVTASGVVTAPRFNTSGNYSTSAWGVSGTNLAILSNNITDTSSSGTVATVTAVNGMASSALVAASVTTYTTATTLYIAGAPTAGANVTITNPYALYVNSGLTLLNGGLVVNRTSSNLLQLQASGTDKITVSNAGALSLINSVDAFSFPTAPLQLFNSAGVAYFKVFNTSANATPNGQIALYNNGTLAGTLTATAAPGFFIDSAGRVDFAAASVTKLNASSTGVMINSPTNGAATASALLTLGDGAATAGRAPLKFTSGTNLTTPENGAMEYNGTNLFFTRTGAVREGVLTQSAITTESLTSDTSITVNIGGVTYKLLAKA